MKWKKVGKTIWLNENNILVQVSYGDLSKVWFLDIAKEIIPYEKYEKISNQSFRTRAEAIQNAKEYMLKERR